MIPESIAVSSLAIISELISAALTELTPKQKISIINKQKTFLFILIFSHQILFLKNILTIIIFVK